MRLLVYQYGYLSEVSTHSGHTPLHLVVFKGHAHVVEAMASTGIDTTPTNHSTSGAKVTRKPSIQPSTSSTRTERTTHQFLQPELRIQRRSYRTTHCRRQWRYQHF